MNRRIATLAGIAVLGSVPLIVGCGAADTKVKAQASPADVTIVAAAAHEEPVVRFIRATGTLTAEEQAGVAAETAGRVVAAPVERGTPVAAGAELIRVSPAETEAQLKEAEANAAQIEARLGLKGELTFDVDAVPEVQNARAAYALAGSEFSRIESLLEQRVVSRSEFDQRKTQLEATRQQLESAKNGAVQQYQALQAARARVSLARKALADTTVRAPFAGLVAQRFVSVGDYVTRGTKVAEVVRINPLRARLTVPEQFVSAVAPGEPIKFEVDAYPNRQFEGRIEYVSPSLQPDQRALTVEAVVPNAKNELKPGLFATARIQQPKAMPGVLVPAAALQTTSGTTRAYIVSGDRIEERVVTVGQSVGDQIEIVNGIKAGERVATTNLSRLADGMKVTVHN
jgi:RND family efflux transporter MFP subunit